jgi:putative glycosyltransferase (TIGR04372 family)
MVNALWAVPAVLVLRALRPWRHIRVGSLIASRIGHFVGDSSMYLALSDGRTADWFWFSGRPSNAQWAAMVKRDLFVRWWVRYLDACNRLIPGGRAHQLPPTNDTRDIDGVFPKAVSKFSFTEDEDRAAREWLARRGWSGEPFICLLVRDSAYLAQDPHLGARGSDRWSYHDYRDSDIDLYVDAVKALVDRGYWVIRMGKAAHKRLAVNHPKVIDYPFEGDKRDLLDIWLSARCRFFVSTGTGIDMVPVVYGIPVVFLNSIPFGNICSFAKTVSVPKQMRWRRDGRPLTLREIISNYYFTSAEFERAGIELEDLPSSAVTATVLEMESRLNGDWCETDDDNARQARAWSVYRAWPGFADHHRVIHPEARIGAAWLRERGDALFA